MRTDLRDERARRSQNPRRLIFEASPQAAGSVPSLGSSQIFLVGQQICPEGQASFSSGSQAEEEKRARRGRGNGRNRVQK